MPYKVDYNGLNMPLITVTLLALERASLWLADGTFKVVPSLFYQLYSIHFEYNGGLNPAGIYCLLCNKSREAYDKLVTVMKNLIP